MLCLRVTFLIGRYNVAFVGSMVLPRNELSIKLSHTGMRNGNMVIKVETTNQHGEKITDRTAEVAQPLPSMSSPGKVLKSLA